MSINKESLDNWKENIYNPATNRIPERKPNFESSSGITKGPVYVENDTTDSNGLPGEFPFIRGVQPTMYRGKLWTMRQYSGFGTAEESNKRYKFLLDQGTTGLSVAFDLPTQMGYDSDDPMSEGEVGKVGVAIDSIEDMEILFDSIPLDSVSTSMTINAPAAILLAMYIAVAEKRGISREKLSGTTQNDILKEYVARGTYIFPPIPSMRLITDMFSFCNINLPKWNSISISGYHIREAGSTAAQEIGFTLANGIAYVEAAIKTGLDVDSFAPRLSFFFNAHNDIFEEAAKFRAARRLWAKIVKERFGAKKSSSMKMRFHTQTGGSTLTAQQPDNNIVRVTLQALAAVMGGTQSLHTNSKDEALALPTEESAEIALRTQQIIAYESGAADVIDPLGGSYYIESLTDQLENIAEGYILKIDSLGGVIPAIEAGYIQREIQRSAYLYQKAIESKENIVVGMNEFTNKEQPQENLLKLDESIQTRQIEKLRNFKVNRDNLAVSDTLKQLNETAIGSGNLVESICKAVAARATLGEITETLCKEFTRYREIVTL